MIKYVAFLMFMYNADISDARSQLRSSHSDYPIWTTRVGSRGKPLPTALPTFKYWVSPHNSAHLVLGNQANDDILLMSPFEYSFQLCTRQVM